MIVAGIYAACLILITLFGVSTPSNSIEWLVAASDNLDAVRITLAALILAAACVPAEPRAKQILLGGISLSLCILLLGNFLVADSFQRLGLQFYTLDMIALLEGIIITALLRAGAYEEENEELFDMFSSQRTTNSST